MNFIFFFAENKISLLPLEKLGRSCDKNGIERKET